MVCISDELVSPGGFPGGLAVKKPPANARDAGDLGLIPGSERSLGARNGNPLQSSCWEMPWTEEPGKLQSMGSQSQTRLSNEAQHSTGVLVIFRETEPIGCPVDP